MRSLASIRKDFSCYVTSQVGILRLEKQDQVG
jgi:hypothetical protein